MRRWTDWTRAAALVAGLFACAPVDAQVAIGGHFLATVAADDLQVRVDGARVLWLIPTTGSPHLIFGSDHNDVTADRVGGTVGGGQGNQATGFAATIGGGSLNTASGSTATVAGGTTALASGSAAAIGGGTNNRAAGARSAIPGGRDALASAHGQLAYSSGGFDPAEGDAQWSLYVPRATTTDASPTEILLDGFFPLSVAADRTIAFQIQVAARSDAGETAGYEITGVIENVGGTTALVGTPVVTVLGEDDPAWGVAVTADDAADSLSIVATGEAATTIRWVAAVRTTEVAF